MLDVRRLRLLRELAARGTVTAVAEALSYTPSAVSQQLAALERDAGVALLERVGRGVRLTDAGRRLVCIPIFSLCSCYNLPGLIQSFNNHILRKRVKLP